MANEFKLVKLLDPVVSLSLGLNPKGEYDASAVYAVGDLVSYLGVSYVCTNPTVNNLPTDTNFWQVIVDPPIKEKFETVNKNLQSYNYVLNYTGSKVSSIVYTVPSVGTITKTFNYTSGKITSIVLSGSTPSSINLTKTFNYTGNKITSTLYS